jgi:hypothetical protein
LNDELSAASILWGTGSPSPSLAFGTVNPNKINNLELNFGVYGTTFM